MPSGKQVCLYFSKGLWVAPRVRDCSGNPLHEGRAERLERKARPAGNPQEIKINFGLIRLGSD